MTLPLERTRSLRWGYEALQEIRDTDLVAGIQRARAIELLRAYPSPDAVLEWIRADAACMPADACLAIEQTGALLRSIWYSDDCPAQLRRSLMFTLRHFPSIGDTKHWAMATGHWTIRTWLLPEDHYG